MASDPAVCTEVFRLFKLAVVNVRKRGQANISEAVCIGRRRFDTGRFDRLSDFAAILENAPVSR